MFQIRKSVELDAGHRVPFHNSQCRHLHGHRYCVTAVIEAEELVDPETKRSDSGMVLDFGILKKLLMQHVHAPFDHKLILWERDELLQVPGFLAALGMTESTNVAGSVIIPCIPTAEGLAKYWGGIIKNELGRPTAVQSIPIVLRLASFEVRETPSSVAVWTPAPYRAPTPSPYDASRTGSAIGRS